MLQQNAVHDQQSVNHLSVSKSKLVYSRLIFVDNKLTLICQLAQQQLATVSLRNTHVIQFIWRDQRL